MCSLHTLEITGVLSVRGEIFYFVHSIVEK